MRRSDWLVMSLLGLLSVIALAQASSPGWTRNQAEAMLGSLVQCRSNPNEELLQWGPNFPGWHRDRQPKAIGRPVKVGSKGVISEILPVSEGGYRVVVHWEPETAGGPYWSTVIGPAQVDVTAASVRPSQLLGRWREPGRSATLELLADGGFKAVDNEGMAVAGKFSLGGDARLTLAIRHDGAADEVVSFDFSLIGDELTLVPATGGRAERYRKE